MKNFFQIADEDGNGRLSKEEIENLCMVSLKRFVKDDGKGLRNDLCEYFTQLIFDSCHVDIEDEIPLEKMKEIILNVCYY